MGKLIDLTDHRMAKACELAGKMLDEYDPVVRRAFYLTCPECGHSYTEDRSRDYMITCDKCGVTFRTVPSIMDFIE